jgi:hypothetical protein
LFCISSETLIQSTLRQRRIALPEHC